MTNQSPKKPKIIGRKQFVFNHGKVALIVRGKHSPDHSPDLMAQHADVIMPNGEIVGFFGENAGNSGEGSGLNLKGVVYDTSPLGMIKNRPYYVDINLARKNNVISTVLIINITSLQAIKFNNYWEILRKKSGEFDIVGENCSTKASAGFENSGLINGGIPGLDTPDNLYQQLRQKYGASSISISGYVGLKLVQVRPPLAPRFNLIIDEIEKVKKVEDVFEEEEEYQW